MLRFVDGYDFYCDSGHSALKYLFLSQTEFAFIVPGLAPPSSFGGGWAFQTPGSDVCLTKVLDAQSTWVVGRHIKVDNDFGSGSFFLSLERGPSSLIDSGNDHTQLAVWITTAGKFEVYAGGRARNNAKGSLILAPGFTMTPNTWYHFELRLSGGNCEIRIDGITIDSGAITILAAPDRYSDRWQSLGTSVLNLDDGYVLDGQGAINNNFLGPCRVTSLFPTSDAAVQWTRSGGASNVSNINEVIPSTDPRPDGDTTFVSSAAAGKKDLYSLAPVPCYGKVFGIAATAIARLTGGAPTLEMVCRADPGDVLSEFSLGAPAGLGPSYSGLQVTAEPGFNDRDIENAWWGFNQTAAGSLRVTQFFLEKLVSLNSAVQFDCGQSSYSY